MSMIRLSLKRWLTSQTLWVILGCVLITAIKIAVSAIVVHVDLLSNADWGRWIFTHGTLGFYENNLWAYSWPTQPPLVSWLYGLDYHFYIFILNGLRWITFSVVPHLAPGHMLWWFDFVLWFEGAKYGTTDILAGYLMTIKLVAILADLFIALTIYFVAKRTGVKRVVLWPLLYLCLPFTWYLSSFWGQYDQIGFLFLLLSMIAAFGGVVVLAPLLFVISLGLKPTSLIFGPFLVVELLKHRSKWLWLIAGVVLALAFIWLSTSLFTKGNPLTYLNDPLLRIVFQKTEFRLTTNSFNFWRIFYGDSTLPQNTAILFIPAQYIGYLLFSILYMLALFVARKKQIGSLFFALCIIGYGGWLFLTNMLERYAFAGLTFGLMACMYQPKLFWRWLILSVTFTLNLYNRWWFPPQFEPLQLLLTWENGLVTRFIALVNVLIFVDLLRVYFAFTHETPRHLMAWVKQLPRTLFAWTRG